MKLLNLIVPVCNILLFNSNFNFLKNYLHFFFRIEQFPVSLCKKEKKNNKRIKTKKSQNPAYLSKAYCYSPRSDERTEALRTAKMSEERACLTMTICRTV